MAGRRLLYLLTLGVCVVFYIAYQQWFSWLLLLAVAGFPWLSLILSLPAMGTVSLSPAVPERLRPGEDAEGNISARCRFPAPPVRAKLRVTRLNTGESWVLLPGEVLPTAHCGGLLVELLKPRCTDYLGLWRRRVRRTETARVLVFPEPLAMPVPPDLDRYLARSWRPKFGGGYAENHELRLYRPGDNLNQVHWKLSAKTGKLILREPMVPQRGLMLLTLDIRGTGHQQDRKFGRLLWLGRYLLEKGFSFEIRALSGRGLEVCPVSDSRQLHRALENLLCAPPAEEGSILDQSFAASWQFYLGGDADETP